MLRIKAPAISRLIVIVLSLCLLLTSPIAVFAHPMGNFTINHYSGIHIESGWIEIRYFIDRAEIPTFQELQRSGLTGRDDDPKLPEYLSSQAQAFLGGLQTTVNGTPAKLRLVSQDVIFPVGAGNLPTMKLGFIYRGELPQDCQAKLCQLHYEDTNFMDHAGWKEVVVVPRGRRFPLGQHGARARQEHRTDKLSDRSDQQSPATSEGAGEFFLYQLSRRGCRPVFYSH